MSPNPCPVHIRPRVLFPNPATVEIPERLAILADLENPPARQPHRLPRLVTVALIVRCFPPGTYLAENLFSRSLTLCSSRAFSRTRPHSHVAVLVTARLTTTSQCKVMVYWSRMRRVFGNGTGRPCSRVTSPKQRRYCELGMPRGLPRGGSLLIAVLFTSVFGL